jgi:DNA-directed RNA polymerase specialized sigma subunit
MDPIAFVSSTPVVHEQIRCYRAANDPAERRRIQAATVAAFRPEVERLVEELPARRRREAEQVGLIGVLVALEKYDAARGIAFATLAQAEALRELARWAASR